MPNDELCEPEVLLNCPHCGNTDFDKEYTPVGCYVSCIDCGLTSPTMDSDYDASKFWNLMCRGIEVEISRIANEEKQKKQTHPQFMDAPATLKESDCSLSAKIYDGD